MKDAWYADGLKFACVEGCVDCCITHGDHAYVYLEPDDVRKLSAHLDLSPGDFLARHTIREDGLVMLRMDQAACHFLGEGGCTVYPARPVQCRTFPFWKENLKTRTSWESVSGFCPGIGQGDHHTRDRIRIELEARKPAGEE